MNHGRSYQSQERIVGESSYEEVVKTALPALITADQARALALVCDLLDRAVSLSGGPTTPRIATTSISGIQPSSEMRSRRTFATLSWLPCGTRPKLSFVTTLKLSVACLENFVAIIGQCSSA